MNQNSIPLHVMEVSLNINSIKLGNNCTDIFLTFIPHSSLDIKQTRSKLISLNTNCKTPVHNTKYTFQCQLNRTSLTNFLQSDSLEIAVTVKNKESEYRVGSSVIPFIKLKSAPIVEKENTLRKQLNTQDVVRDENGGNKGEID